MTIQTNLIDHPYQLIRVAKGEIVGHYKSKAAAVAMLEQMGNDIELHDTANPKPPTDMELFRMTKKDMGDSYNVHLPDGTIRSTGYVGAGSFHDPEGFDRTVRAIWNDWAARRG